MRKAIVLAMFCSLAFSVGCKDRSRGVVVGVSKRRGLLRSDFESRVNIRLADGSTTELSEVGNPFYILSFVEVSADDPGFIDPRMRKLAERFKLNSVAVIQMSMPKAKTKFSEEAIAEANLQKVGPTNLSRFLDPDRHAWRAFREPEPETILIVDRRGVFGRVRKKGALDEPQRAILHVEWMQKEWEIGEREMDIEP